MAHAVYDLKMLPSYCGVIYDHLSILTSRVMRLLTMKGGEASRKLDETLEYLELSVDDLKPNRFGFVVQTQDGEVTLRSFAKRLREHLSVRPLVTSTWIESVTMDRTDTWNCTAEEYYSNVIQFYDGVPHAWPNHEHLKAEFLKMDSSQQLYYMTFVSDFFVSNPSSRPSVHQFLKDSRTSLGVYKVRISESDRAQAFAFGESQAAALKKTIEKLAAALTEIPSGDASQSAKHLLSTLREVQNLDRYDYCSDLWHHLYVLGEDPNSAERTLLMMKILGMKTSLGEQLLELRGHNKALLAGKELERAIVHLERYGC